MNSHRFKTTVLAAALVAASALVASAQTGIRITEINSAGSGAQTDWFELTNFGPSTVSLTNARMDDNSNSFSLGAVLNNVSSLAPGQSAVFLQPGSAGGFAAAQTAFLNAWFTGGVAPSGFLLGYAVDGGIGLSGSGDAVNIWDSSQTLLANVTFGSNASNAGRTFDNSSGLNNAAITTLSTVGVNGAFLSASGAETGSPGIVSAIPEPSTYAMILGLGVMATAVLRRKRTQAA